MPAPTRYILLYDGPNDAPDVQINHDTNLFLPGVTVYQFIENLNEVISYIKPSLRVEPAYPNYIINTETDKEFADAMTWEVKMQPAKLGGKPKEGSDSGTQEAKERLRTEVESRDKIYMVYGQMFDAWFAFTFWSQTASESEKLAQWFQFNFIPHYGDLLGSAHLRFARREHDKELLKVNNLLQTRTLTYYVQLSVNSAIEAKKIQEIKLKLDSKV